jgi:hypothetical protein
MRLDGLRTLEILDMKATGGVSQYLRHQRDLQRTVDCLNSADLSKLVRCKRRTKLPSIKEEEVMKVAKYMQEQQLLNIGRNHHSKGPSTSISACACATVIIRAAAEEEKIRRDRKKREGFEHMPRGVPGRSFLERVFGSVVFSKPGLGGMECDHCGEFAVWLEQELVMLLEDINTLLVGMDSQLSAPLDTPENRSFWVSFLCDICDEWASHFFKKRDSCDHDLSYV